MPERGVLDWLLSGDPAIAYQAARDLLGDDRPELQARILTEGWGARVMAARHADGHWGQGFYAPKWTSTHYTLLDLRNMCAPAVPALKASVALVLGEVNTGRPTGRTLYTDTCINGMALNYASWFGAPEEALAPFVDYLIDDQMGDGGFNCQRIRLGAHHSSLHSTLSVLEGIESYRAGGYGHRLPELLTIAEAARDFILIHRFFRSDHSGEIINPAFLRFPICPRWRYNILRALDHFAAAGAPHDARMDEALAVIAGKRRADGRWAANAADAGAVHLVMERPRQPSRWITLAASRVLARYS